PLARYLEARGATIRRGATVDRATPQPGGGFVVDVDLEGEAERAVTDLLVLATTVPGLRRIVGNSPELGDAAWRARVEGLALTRPFAVWRLWLDRPLDAGR